MAQRAIRSATSSKEQVQIKKKSIIREKERVFNVVVVPNNKNTNLLILFIL